MNHFITFIFILISIHVNADNQNLNDFQSGIELYQKQNYSEAVKKFEKLHQEDKSFAELYYNWALSEYQQQNYGKSLALLRKALFINEGLGSAIQAIDFIYKTQPQIASLVQGEKSQLRVFVAEYLSLNKLFMLTWILFLFSAYLLVRYFAKRRTAILDEKPLPPWPAVASFMTLCFIFCIILVGIKISTRLESRATVVASSVSLKTSPSIEGNSIFDLSEGMDVKILSVNSGWALVTIDSGVSGWVEIKSLFQHSGYNKLW